MKESPKDKKCECCSFSLSAMTNQCAEPQYQLMKLCHSTAFTDVAMFSM